MMASAAGGASFGYVGPVPYVTAAQMREVDRLMTEVYGIDLVRMMESAGRQVARLARDRFLDGDTVGKEVGVLAGPGGNGGGALVCARHLLNWGARVHVSLSVKPDALAPVPRDQLGILERLAEPITIGPPPGSLVPAVVIDGVIGYSLVGPPRGGAIDLITWGNGQPAPVLAIDVPSGLDPTTGLAHEPTISAAATLTLALPKAGLAEPAAAPFVGELYLADIGVPPRLLPGSAAGPSSRRPVLARGGSAPRVVRPRSPRFIRRSSPGASRRRVCLPQL